MAKYYWLKLNKDFFKRHDIRIVEAMPNGKDYVLFYLKLLCESTSHDGNLRFSEEIPYNEEMLSALTNTNIDIVRSAVKVLSSVRLMELFDDGTYFMTKVNEMIGSAANNDNANRQRRFRERKKQEALQEYHENITTALQERYECVTKNNEILDNRYKILDNNIISNDIICQTQSVRRVIEEWNTLSVFGISQVAKIDSNSKRYKSLVARLNQYGEEQVLKAIDNIRYSDFLQGKHDGKHWQITFDWFVLPNNFPKVLENNYKNVETNFSNGRKNYQVNADEINAIVEAGFNLAANN